MYREEQSGAGFVMGVLTGAFIGAGVALLFAPRSGQETRNQLGEQYRGLADRTQGLRDRANQLRDQGRERLHQMRGQMSDRTTGSEYTTSSSAPDRFPSSAPTV